MSRPAATDVPDVSGPVSPGTVCTFRDRQTALEARISRNLRQSARATRRHLSRAGPRDSPRTTPAARRRGVCSSTGGHVSSTSARWSCSSGCSRHRPPACSMSAVARGHPRRHCAHAATPSTSSIPCPTTSAGPTRPRRALGLSKVLTAGVGDARTLQRCATAPHDAVLMLGPLYHLIERGDRALAWAEAVRATAPGGVVAAVGISRFASLLDGLKRNVLSDPVFSGVVEDDLRTGQHRNPDVAGRPELFTTAYFHRPDELVSEAASVRAGRHPPLRRRRTGLDRRGRRRGGDPGRRRARRGDRSEPDGGHVPHAHQWAPDRDPDRRRPSSSSASSRSPRSAQHGCSASRFHPLIVNRA